MFRLGLNPEKNVYNFYDPETNFMLTLSDPVGFTDRVTLCILKGLKIGRIVDIDNVIDIEKGELKTVVELINEVKIEEQVQPKEEIKEEIIPVRKKTVKKKK
jgi:hypothetical protein